MLAILIDNDFREPIVTGLLAREPGIDILRVRQIGLRHAGDREILEWAALHGRVVVTHDVNTMVGFAYERVAARLAMTGVLAVAQQIPTRLAIEDLLLAVGCYEAPDMDNLVRFFPM